MNIEDIPDPFKKFLDTKNNISENIEDEFVFDKIYDFIIMYLIFDIVLHN